MSEIISSDVVYEKGSIIKLNNNYYILGNSYLVAGKETGITAFPLDIINGEPYYDSDRMYHNDERRIFTRNDLKNSIFIKKGF